MTVPAVQVKTSRQQVSVLIIEDDARDAAASEKILASSKERPAFTAQRAASLAEAREKLEKDVFDLILLDLTLPDGSGVDALENLQALAPEAPILLLTNLDDEPTAVKREKPAAR